MAKIYGLCDFKGDLRQPTNEDLNIAEKGGLGFPILGVVEGTHFVPNGESRNKRWYSEELWSKAISSEKVQRKIANRTMFGRIGHEAEITDEDIAEGRFSHFTTDLALMKGNIPGYARTYILDTPMGRILYTLLKAKCRLYTSSRADGSFLDQVINGCKVLDPDTYDLERFDFVVEPGFLQAEPKLVESFSTNDLNLIDQSEKLAESILNNEESKSEVKEESLKSFALENILAENESLKLKLEESQKSQRTWLTKLMSFGLANAGKFDSNNFVAEFEKASNVKFEDAEKEEILISAKDAKWLKESYNAEPNAGIQGKDPSIQDQMIPEASSEDAETLELVKQLGGIQAIKDALTFTDDYFSRVGTPQQIEAVLDNFDKIFKKLGSPASIEECLKRTNAFIKRNGTFEAIENSLEEAKKRKKTSDKMEKILDALKKENEQLKNEQLNFNNIKSELDNIKKENEALKISNATGIDLDKVKAKFAEGLDANGVKEFFERSTPEINESVNNSFDPNKQRKINESAEVSCLANVFGWKK